jgi:transcription initiation factor TFIIE subunit alpha
LAASAAPSTQHTPPGEFSVLGDYEEDRKPNIEYLDALNEHNKRSRSVENEGKAERKQARVEDGWGLQGAQENGELSMNGTESLGVNAEDLPTEDPMVYGVFFLYSFYAMLSGRSISVDGKPMPFSQVGEEHHDLMTADEYAAYFEIFQQRSA